MSYAAPALRWAGLRAGADGDRPGVEVPAALSALGGRERSLLEARLAVRCRVPAVLVAPGGRDAVLFVGPTVEALTPAFRRAADEAIRSVSPDAAAGWTADDERERHRPFSWGDAERAPDVPRSSAPAHGQGDGRPLELGRHVA